MYRSMRQRWLLVCLTFLQVFFIMERKLDIVHRQARVLGKGWRVSVSIFDQLNCELENVSIWLKATKLLINVSKIKLMISPARQKVCLIWTPLLNIHNNLVEIVETTKCLGVYPIFSVMQTAESIGVIFQVNPNVHHNSLLSLYAL